MNERLMRAALTRVAEPMDPAMTLLVHRHGPQGAIGYVGAGRLPDGFIEEYLTLKADSTKGTEKDKTPDLTAKLTGWRTRLRRTDPGADLRRFQRDGGRLICPGDPEWPSQLDDLGIERPYALWVRGNADLRFACLRSISIVGSRDATNYGKDASSEFAASLGERQWTVVSGGAYGIDAAAHRGAMASGEAPTIAVLACGVDVAYPIAHQELFQEITGCGLLISEWAPGVKVTRPRFLVRNRVIAALTRCTVVVEAANRSGAISTASHAIRLNRPVAAVPGSINSANSAGCHRMIREQSAVLVTRPEEVLELAAGMGEALPPERRDPVLPRDALDETSRCVLEAIPARGAGPATIAMEAGVDLATVVRCVGVLSAGGFVERAKNGWRPRRTQEGTEGGPPGSGA